MEEDLSDKDKELFDEFVDGVGLLFLHHCTRCSYKFCTTYPCKKLHKFVDQNIFEIA